MAVNARNWLTLFFCICFSSHLFSQIEDCTNGIDDDQDGLVDLKDDDCNCPDLEPISLLPNTSFESNICCPDSNVQITCIESWVNASAASPDYYHFCDPNDLIEFFPSPIPDGDGFMGLIDGIRTSSNNPNWKEYIGLCLPEPLEQDTIYQFELFVGFQNRMISPPGTMVLYGTRNCSNLPFGNGEIDFGCPTNSGAWERLGFVDVRGDEEWIKYSFEFSPLSDIEAIAIGPDCFPSNSTRDTYYLLDGLVLAKRSEFLVSINEEGNPCIDEFKLFLPPKPNRDYQWYYEGVAIVGETSNELLRPTQNGNYTIRVIEEDRCTISEDYTLVVPRVFVSVSDTICQGDTYALGNMQYEDPGQYLDTLIASDGCDSIVSLVLTVLEDVVSLDTVVLSEGTSFQFGNQTISQEGMYEQMFTSSIGCDSIVLLSAQFINIFIPNVFSPNGDNINDRFLIPQNPFIGDVVYVGIYDRYGNLVFDDPQEFFGRGWDGRYDGMEAVNGVYTFVVEVISITGDVIIQKGSVLLTR